MPRGGHKPHTSEAKSRQVASLNRKGRKKGERSGREIPLPKICIALLHNNSNASAAARELGITKWAIYRHMKLPEFDAVMKEMESEFLKASAKETAKKVVREITIDRNDIIMGLADIAQMGESERAKVAAWLGLADIFLLRSKNTRDMNDFVGWTADELDRYAATGNIPDRFRSTFGAGKSETASLRTERVGITPSEG